MEPSLLDKETTQDHVTVFGKTIAVNKLDYLFYYVLVSTLVFSMI